MEGQSWNPRLSNASQRYQSSLHSRSEFLMGFEEVDGDEDMREEFPCPFCSDYFDIVGLCCHIDDEHPSEARNGVCPICAMRVGVDMVSHITLHHGNSFKFLRKIKSRKGGSHSALSILRKELREGKLRSLFGGSFTRSSSNAAPDPLLSSFILPIVDNPVSVHPHFSSEIITDKKSCDDNISERLVQIPPMSTKDKEEKTRKSEFVQGMLMSTIFGDANL